MWSVLIIMRFAFFVFIQRSMSLFVFFLSQFQYKTKHDLWGMQCYIEKRAKNWRKWAREEGKERENKYIEKKRLVRDFVSSNGWEINVIRFMIKLENTMRATVSGNIINEKLQLNLNTWEIDREQTREV